MKSRTDRALAAEVQGYEERRHAMVRRAILLGFVVSKDPRLVVRRNEVFLHVAEDLSEIIRPSLMAEVEGAIRDMGAVSINIGQRWLYRGVRRADMSETDAIASSRALRRSLRRSGTKPRRAPVGAVGGAPRKSQAEYEAILAAEGMPAEPYLLDGRGKPRVVSNRSVSKRKADAVALNQGPDSHARDPSAREDIYRARQTKIERILDAVEEDRAVIKLTAEGLSIRQIEARLGIHRSSVERALERAKRTYEAVDKRQKRRDKAPKGEADTVEDGRPKPRSVPPPAQSGGRAR